MVTTNDVRELINQVQVDKVLYSNQDSLYDCGILDSLTTIHLMLIIEKEYNIVLDQSSLQMEDFENVECICNYINRLLKEEKKS